MISLAWPASIEQLIGNSIVFADILFLARLGSEAIAGVGICATLIFAFVAIFNSVAVASTTVVAQAKGAGVPGLVEKGAAQSILLSVLLGVISGGAGALVARPTMSLMGAAGAVQDYGVIYMRPVLLASPLYAIALTGGGILRGSGDTRTPMIFTLVSNSLKIVLSWFLVFGKAGCPCLGVRGAALASVISYAVNALLLGAKLSYGFDAVRLRMRAFLPDINLLKQITRLAMPVAGELLIMRAGFIFYMRVVSALGTLGLAANQIAMRIESISLSVAFGFTTAATTLVGQAVGRRDLTDAARNVVATARLSLISMCSMTVIMILARHWAVGIFTPEAAVSGPAIVCVVIAAFEVIPLGFIFTFSGALRGAGDTRSPMIVAIVGTFLFRLPLVYLLGVKSGLGLPGIWCGTILDWIGRSIVIYLIYRTGAWKHRAIVAAPCPPGSDMLESEATCRE
ncbi:MAG TPA: MATE family efflux transporter [bacterium]|nr:MATE family efflux transporter [bacterium]